MASDAGGPRAPSQIVDFYAGQTLFLTGVTGFLGKIVLAQLLQHCPKIKKVFCLIRGRQGVSAAARFEKEVFSIELFTNLIKKDPSIKDKMHVRLVKD
jgi:fatty acyl-CoA reductase